MTTCKQSLLKNIHNAMVEVDGVAALRTVVEGGGGSGGGETTSDRELVVTTYFATDDAAGITTGDIITVIQILDVTEEPAVTVSEIWRNRTTATDLSSPPSSSILDLVGASTLTDAQLRASPVEVTGTVLANIGSTTDPFSYTYTYNANGDRETATRVGNGVTQVKTYTYNLNNQRTGESAWITQ